MERVGSQSSEAPSARSARPWWRVSIYLPTLGFVALLWWLGQPGHQNRSQSFFYLPVDETAMVQILQKKLPMELQSARHDDGTTTFEIALRSSEGPVLTASPSVSLSVATYLKKGELVAGELRLADAVTGVATARFEAVPGQSVEDNQSIRFVRVGELNSDAVNADQIVTVSIRTRGLEALAFWSFQTTDSPLSGYLWASEASPSESNVFRSVFGTFELVGGESALNRAQLLTYMWGFPAGQTTIVFGGVTVALLLWILGSFGVGSFFMGVAHGSQIGFAISAGILSLAVGIVYLILIPPYQVADEPDHFLTMGLLMGEGHLDPGALSLAQRSHSERIRCHPSERFSTLDVGRPAVGGWKADISPTESNRSPLARTIWWRLGQFLKHAEANVVLLSVRCVNVIFVAISVGVAFWIMLRLAPSGTVQAQNLVPMLGIPSVVFTLAGCSNYAFLISGCILQCAAIVALLQADVLRRTRTVWITAGAGTAIAIVASDNGVFYVGFWAIVLTLWSVFSGVILAKANRVSWSGFWYIVGMVGVGIIVYAAAGGGRVLPVMAEDATKWLMPSLADSPATSSAIVAVIFFGLLAVVPPLGFTVGLRCGFLNRIQGVKILAAIVIVLVLFVVFAPTRQIPNLQSSPAAPTLLEYCGSCVYSLLEGFGPGAGDVFVVKSFWGLVGWLDTALPALTMNALRYGCAVGLVLLIVNAIKCKEIGVPVVLLTSLMALFIALSVACLLIDYNLHGRYLVGFYLLLLMVSAEGFRRTFPSRKGMHGVVLATCLACVMLIQASAWSTIINRYY